MEDSQLPEHLESVPLAVEIEVCRLSMPLEAALDLKEGITLKSNQPVGSPMNVYVGGILFATAEPVKIDGKDCARVREMAAGAARSLRKDGTS